MLPLIQYRSRESPVVNEMSLMSAHQMGLKDGDVMQAVEKARAAVGEPQVLLSEISSLDGFVIFG